jgi:hypothetical protein
MRKFLIATAAVVALSAFGVGTADARSVHQTNKIVAVNKIEVNISQSGPVAGNLAEVYISSSQENDISADQSNTNSD